MEKRCTGICQKIKDLDEFGKNCRSPDGHAYKCKECVKIPNKAIGRRSAIQALSSTFTLGKV